MTRTFRNPNVPRLCFAIAALMAVAVKPVSAQTAIDQQNPASAWTCLNVDSFTMSQGFTPTFNRMNFADIHLTGNSGSIVDGDFSLRVLRNGSLVRESDRLIIDAVPGMQSGYHRFTFSNEVFLQAGQPYELQLVNHSDTSFFRWCQSESDTYAGGAPTVSPSGGGSGDFLFRTGMQSIYGPPQATPYGDGYVLFESALKPQEPVSITTSTAVDDRFYSGLNFEITEPTRLSKVGAYFSYNVGGPIFAAVVQATGFASIPNPPDLTGSDVLATTLINVPPGGGDAHGDVDVMLQQGWYGLLFGSGRFGATGDSALRDMPAPNGGYWSHYSIRQSDGARFFQSGDIRVFAEASSAPGTIQARPVFDTEAEQFAGQWILTDGGQSVAPDRFDFYGIDARGLMEFDLRQIPAEATITSVQIALDPDQLTSGGGGGPRIFFHGYAGDGAAAASDASVPLNLIGTSQVVEEFEIFETSLDAAYVQSLVELGATHLGLMMRGDSNGHRVHYRTWEFGSPESVPLLTIEYSLPGDFNADGLINDSDLVEWKARFGSDLDGNDFLAWQRNLTPSPQSGIPAPEPTALTGLTLAVTALLASCGRKVPRP